MPYFQVTIPAGTAVGQTVNAKIDQMIDANIGQAVARVTLIGEMTLRVEPDDELCRIVSATTEDGETTLHVLRSGKVAFKNAIDR